MKVRFMTPLVVRVDTDDRATLIADFVVQVDTGAVTVPAGFHTDFASVPRLPLAYALFGGKAQKAAVVHDYLYGTHVDRAFADRVFLAAMRAQKVAAWRRALMWVGVRLAGWAFRRPAAHDQVLSTTRDLP